MFSPSFTGMIIIIYYFLLFLIRLFKTFRDAYPSDIFSRAMMFRLLVVRSASGAEPQIGNQPCCLLAGHYVVFDQFLSGTPTSFNCLFK